MVRTRSKSRSMSRSRSRSRSPRERIDKFGRVIPADRSRSKSRSRSRSSSRRVRRRSRSRSPYRGRYGRRSRSPQRGDARFSRDRGDTSRERTRDLRNVQNRTNIEDPEFLNARLFIGSLPSSRVTKEELEELFKRYGKILGMFIKPPVKPNIIINQLPCTMYTMTNANFLGVSIHDRGFGFVQFEKEEDALKAKEGENSTRLKGSVLDVKMAAEGRRGGPAARRGGGPPPPPGRGDHFDRDGPPAGRGGPPPPGHMRDRSPTRGDPYDDRYRDPYRRDPPPPPPAGRGDYDRSGGDPPPPPTSRDDPYYRDDPYRRPPPPPGHDDPYRDPYRDDPYRRDAPPGPPPFRRDPYDDPYRDPYYRDPFYPPPPKKPLPADVQIICMNKQLTQYAESMEVRLRQSALIVDIVVIAEEMTVPAMIEEANRLKCLFAITINSQNEAHKSLTLNILHGTPQEHRNMPMEDAVKLIATSFEKYIQTQKEKAAGPAPTPAAAAPSATPSAAPGAPPFVPPSTDVSYLLNLLADNRQLTLEEIEKVIDYLRERKNKMLGAEGRPSEGSARPGAGAGGGHSSSTPGSGDAMSSLQQQQQEIQSKILNILNGSGSSTSGTLSAATPSLQAVQGYGQPQPPTRQPPASAQGGGDRGGGAGGNNPLINLDNPNVQKALDNLIQSGPNLLKSLPSSMGQQAQAPPRNQFAGQGGQSGGPRYASQQPSGVPPPAPQQGGGQYGGQYGGYQQQGAGGAAGAPQGQANPRPFGGGAYGGQQAQRPLMSVRAPQQGVRPRY